MKTGSVASVGISTPKEAIGPRLLWGRNFICACRRLAGV